MSWTTEKSEASSTSSIGFIISFSGRLFMQIKKSNDAKIEPCSTPASTLVQKEYCQCKTTLCFLLFKRILRRLLVTPFYFNLKTRTSCYTLWHVWTYQEKRFWFQDHHQNINILHVLLMKAGWPMSHLL